MVIIILEIEIINKNIKNKSANICIRQLQFMFIDILLALSLTFE